MLINCVHLMWIHPFSSVVGDLQLFWWHI